MELEIEESIWQEGYEKIACCDEVGRGCLFGSVLAAAVIFPKGLKLEGVKDSKKLSPKKREAMYSIILENALAVGIGMVSPEMIDKINIKNATRHAMKEAVLNLKDRNGNLLTPDYILIDAEEIDTSIPQKPIVKGDDLVHGIAAASIIAKVTRDRLCKEWHETYPLYGIDQHKGYGTKAHREALIKYGATDMHRKSFLKKILL
ncbi:ribonuclease HII [Clostridium formicaceticum]|uniref:Ribonuclease HII n=1 Tax=Clostridium formicaceticum TaxID=1497 RepID=A0AAC9RLJ4_9CLOT|nr:ribonuclease HII [Clostridium formicaceticum]AOY77333.1 ribonuclease HII [Clostridium formicaceticum]ARE87877.1 Ribonuclease HII [Clostridium formicaceticum]